MDTMKGLYTYGAADLRDIVLAPLEAIVKADIALSEKMTEFIAWYGFEPAATDQQHDMGNVKLISFSYPGKDGETATVSLPALSLIQLPLLKIQQATIDMDLKLVTTAGKESKSWPSLLPGEKITPPAQKSGSLLKAFLCPDNNHSGKNLDTNMKIKLSMGEGDMPGGIIKLLSVIHQIHHLHSIHHEQD